MRRKSITFRHGYPLWHLIDIIEYIARQEGWTLRYVKGNLDRGLDRLAKANSTLMPDVAFTAERENLYPFTKSRYCLPGFRSMRERAAEFNPFSTSTANE
jgi:hypothetical protein